MSLEARVILSVEKRAQLNKHRYSKAAKSYCYRRWCVSQGGPRDCEVFWLRMHHLLGLMESS